MHDEHDDDHDDDEVILSPLGARILQTILDYTIDDAPPDGPWCRLAFLSTRLAACALACGARPNGVGPDGIESFDLDVADLPAISAAGDVLTEAVPRLRICSTVGACGAPVGYCTDTRAR